MSALRRLGLVFGLLALAAGLALGQVTTGTKSGLGPGTVLGGKGIYIAYAGGGPATTFYVDATLGSDTAAGTNTGAAAWQHLSHAFTNAPAGSTLWLAPSETYAENGLVRSNALTITSTASTRATFPIISGTTGYAAMVFQNAGNCWASNLTFRASTNIPANYPFFYVTNAGIAILNTGTASIANLGVANCVLTNCGWGLVVWNPSATAGGISGISISNNFATNNQLGGFGLMSGPPTLPQAGPYTIGNFIVASNEVSGSFGNGNGTSGSGVGIGWWGVTNGMIQGNYVHNSGTNSTVQDVGLIGSDCSSVTCRWNQVAFEASYGIDPGQNTTNCMWYANYVHHSGNADCYYDSASSASFRSLSNSVCYNLFAYGGSEEWIDDGATMTNNFIYNNTLVGFPSNALLKHTATGNGWNLFANNNFVTLNNGACFWATSLGNLQMSGNNYFSLLGVGEINWNGTSEGTIAGFRSLSGQETGTGYMINPQFWLTNEVTPLALGANWAQLLTNQAPQTYTTLPGAGINLAAYGVAALPAADLVGETTSPNAIGCYTPQIQIPTNMVNQLSNNWLFTEGSGTTDADTVDSSPLTFYGTPTWTAGPSGGQAGALKAMSFNGTSQGAYAANTNCAFFTSNSLFSLTFWLYLTNTTSQPVVCSKGHSANGGFFVQCSGVNMTVSVSQNGTYQNTTMSGGLITGAWQWLAITYDGTHIHLFNNGVEQGYSTQPATSPPTYTGSSIDYAFRIGAYTGPNFYLAGAMADVKTWSRQLSQADISYLYNFWY